MMTLTTNFLNIRTGPSASYSSIGKFDSYDEIEVIEKNPSTGFLKISFEGKTGWIIGSAKYVTIIESMDKTGTTEDISGYLNIRKGPSTSYSTVGKIYPDKTFEIIGKTDGWYKIKYNNTVGFVNSSYVTVK